MKRPCAPGAEGYAVAVVLLLLLALTGLAHGALLLAERERWASSVEARLIGRRLLARAGARSPAGADTLPALGEAGAVLASGERPPWHWATEAHRLGGDLILLVGIGRADPLGRSERVAVAAAALDPAAHVAALRAVVEVGEVDPGAGQVSSAGWLEPPEPAAREACEPELHALDSLGARPPTPVVRAPLASFGGGRVPNLGVLPGDSVLARIATRVEGVARPAPAFEAGACAPGPANWGSPGEPTGPCGRRMVVAASEGSLRVEGGEGQGVLIAVGDLILAAGARFDGFVLVGGDLVLEGGSRLVGAARVGGALRLPGGRIDGSACAAARAFRAAPSLRRPYLLPDAAPIHPF